MLDFDAAQQRLATAAPGPTATTTVDLAQAPGRVVAESITATLDLPPADNSAMDGYAIRHADWHDGLALPVQQRCYAGDTPQPLQPGKTIRLFTGSLMPEGADTVVMQEYASEADDVVTLTQPPEKARHVRYRGEDVRAGSELVSAGTVVGAGEIALLASQGISRLTVYPRLRVGIVTTGDELVQPGQPRTTGQIYNSNGPMLAAMVTQMGAEATRVVHADDTLDAIRGAFERLLDDCDLVLSVGGVSVGDKDLVKPALEGLGAELDMWRVRMKPGRPVALAHARNKPVIGIPGNPVSAFVVFALLVTPLIRTMQGRSRVFPGLQYGKLATGRTLGGSRDEFLRAQVQADAGGLPRLVPHADQGSAIMRSLPWADGLVRIAAGSQAGDGDVVPWLDLKHWLS